MPSSRTIVSFGWRVQHFLIKHDAIRTSGVEMIHVDVITVSNMPPHKRQRQLIITAGTKKPSDETRILSRMIAGALPRGAL